MPSADDIRKFTKEDLEAELKRREVEKDLPPVPMANPNFTPLINLLLGETEYIRENRRPSKDIKQWVYEEAIKAVYGNNGKAFWDWSNKYQV